MRGWLERLSIRHQLWALFGMFLLAGAMLLVIDETAQHRARQSLLALQDDSLARVRSLKAVSDLYGLDVVDTTFRVRNSLITWDEGIETLDRAHAQIDRHWAALRGMPRSAQQQAVFVEITAARGAADQASAHLRQILRARDMPALGRFADTTLYPSIDPVTRRIQLLSDLAMLEADQLVRADLERSRRVSLLRIVLSLLALLTIALLGRRVLRNAYRGIEALTWLARRMRARDYTAVSRYRPRGELATVMEAFVDMRRDVLGFETELTGQLARNERVVAELERRDCFQRSLLDSAQVAILVIDAQGCWSVFNPFAERLLGWHRDEILGKVVRYGGVARPDDSPQLIAPERIEAVVARLSELTGRAVPSDWRALFELAALHAPPAESQLLHRDGHLVPVLMALSAFDDEHGERAGVIAVATDLSDLKRLEDSLRQSEARARAASQAKSSFLAAMSHEIRTPLIGVTGMIEILAHTRLDPDQRRALNVVQQSSDSLLQIVGDILDFSKIEAGRLELAPAVTSLPALVRSTVANYTGAASSKGLALQCSIDERIAAAHHADPLRLRQILGNVIANAIKFTARGEVQVGLEWRAAIGPGPDAPLGSQRLSLRISDSGIGISAQAQQQLFQPFSQAEGDTTRRFGGTGLGLAICKRLAALMGGELSLESVPGVGTTVRLELTLPCAAVEDLPRDPTAAATLAAFTPRQLPTVERAEHERSLVLLVDDHPTNRLVIARQLALAGYACETAEDGVQGLQHWRSGRHALVLSDVHMPGLDGYQLARAIRSIEDRDGIVRTPVIALTASALKGEAERCLAAGMDDYLAKPVSMPVLLACLQRWLPHTLPADIDIDTDAAPADAADVATGDGTPRPATATLPQLAHPPVLDASVLNALGGGAELDVRALLDDFLASTIQDLSLLETARAAGDAVALTRQAHKIKGAARLVGASELGDAASALENRGRRSDWPAVLPLAADLHTATQRLRLYVDEHHPA